MDENFLICSTEFGLQVCCVELELVAVEFLTRVTDKDVSELIRRVDESGYFDRPKQVAEEDEDDLVRESEREGWSHIEWMYECN